MNSLKMDVKQTIGLLLEQGWSQRRIARELQLDRATVRRWGERLGKKDSPGPSLLEGNAATTTPGRPSDCQSYNDEIVAGVDQGLSAQRIWQDLGSKNGFTGSYQSVKRYIRQLKKKQPQRFWRMECQPGEEAQVDFCSGYWLQEEGGRKKKTHVLRIVLSYSRKAYSQAVLHQDTESFLRCIENGFRHFGGVTATLNLDNLKAAVIQADWYDPEINPKLIDFARFYATAVLPCKPRMARHKGKVENGMAYVQGNALAGRTFGSVAQLNAHLLDWEKNIADMRIHGTTRKQVCALFDAEKAHLKPLPSGLFPCFREGPRMVHRDSYVEVARAFYEVPAEYIGHSVWVRWDGRMVRVLTSELETIISHPQIEPGRFSKSLGCQGHPCPSIEESHGYYVKKVAPLGVHVLAWAQGTWETRGPIAIRLLQGLLGLTKNHRAADIDQACHKVLDCGQWKLKNIRSWLEHPTVAQATLPFLESHPLIRDMADYQAIVGSFEKADPQTQLL